MIEQTEHGVLVAKKEGIYTVYVFQLDAGQYIMCTKLPNWGNYNLDIGQSGYITTQYAEAGELYFDRHDQTTKMFQYTNMYFKEFIKDNKVKEIVI
jgi:hypothetical protein